MFNDKEFKKKIHKVALENKISDRLAEIIVTTPFLFQKKILDKGELDPRRFYHKYLGNFYIKYSVVKKIKEKL